MERAQTYDIVTIPKLRSEPEPEADLLKLAEKFYNIRMNALQVAADAFASTQALEKEHGVTRAVNRLSNAKAVQFIAVRRTATSEGLYTEQSDLESLLNNQWVGMNVLLGPEEGNELSVPSANLDPFHRMTDGAENSAPAPAWHSVPIHKPAEAGELHFHINGMFVDPSARGAGLGRKLMDAALARAEAMAASEGGSKLRVSLSVFAHNLAARKLYEDSGFRTLIEQQARSRPGFIAVHMEKSYGPGGSL